MLSLYDALSKGRPDPIIGPSRAIVTGQVHGPKAALKELARLPGKERLETYPFHFAAPAEFAKQAQDKATAKKHLERAQKLARNETERKLYKTRLASL